LLAENCEKVSIRRKIEDDATVQTDTIKLIRLDPPDGVLRIIVRSRFPWFTVPC
jgi:hypothetical protein